MTCKKWYGGHIYHSDVANLTTTLMSSIGAKDWLIYLRFLPIGWRDIFCVWLIALANSLRTGSRGHPAAAGDVRRPHTWLGGLRQTVRGRQRRRRALFHWTSWISPSRNLRSTYSWYVHCGVAISYGNQNDLNVIYL